MIIVRKWFPKRKNSLPLRRKEKKNKIDPDKNIEINVDPKICYNLQVLNNQTKTMTEKKQLIDSMSNLSNNYHDGNCICLFIMLVLYYLSIITTKFKNTLEKSINRKN